MDEFDNMEESEEGDLGKSWAVKYRPRKLEEYCGSDIVQMVKKRFKKRSNMPHVVMMNGPSGCGKTTLSRLLCKYYQCENPNEDGTPCGECETCKTIDEILIGGESTQVECPGVLEVDATTANGKDAIQEIIDEALQAPIYSKYKIIIFDECHRITGPAQNSLLKVIEDIPSHLVIIFATTDPQQVLKTIISRCQLIIEVHKQSIKEMTDRLMYIAEQEKLQVSRQALEIIVKKKGRAPRECINLLEALAKTYAGEVTLETLKDYFGSDSTHIYVDFFRAANTSLADILTEVKKLKNSSTRVQDFVNGLTSFVLDSLYIKHAIDIDEYSTDYVKEIKELFEFYNSSDFDVLLQVLDNLSRSIVPDNDSKNEMLLIVTAMRISKIKLLANGLGQEQSEAIAENKESLFEHSKKLSVDNSKVIEQLKVDITPADIKDSFDSIEQVVNTKNLLDTVTIPDIIEVEETEEEEKVDKVSLGKEVDDFFNQN